MHLGDLVERSQQSGSRVSVDGLFGAQACRNGRVRGRQQLPRVGGERSRRIGRPSESSIAPSGSPRASRRASAAVVNPRRAKLGRERIDRLRRVEQPWHP